MVRIEAGNPSQEPRRVCVEKNVCKWSNLFMMARDIMGEWKRLA
jgi:hypothetical protein